MKQLIASACFFLCAVTFAEAKDRLLCLPIKQISTASNYILNHENTSTRANIYFIENISKDIVWLNHQNTKYPTENTGWASMLRADNWSAILLSQKDFNLTCATSIAGSEKPLDCSSVIRVCKTNILKNKRLSDNYWYVENLPAEAFIRTIFARLKKL